MKWKNTLPPLDDLPVNKDYSFGPFSPKHVPIYKCKVALNVAGDAPTPDFIKCIRDSNTKMRYKMYKYINEVNSIPGPVYDTSYCDSLYASNRFQFLNCMNEKQERWADSGYLM